MTQYTDFENLDLCKDLLPRSFKVIGDPADPLVREQLWAGDEQPKQEEVVHYLSIDLNRYEVPRWAELAWKKFLKQRSQSEKWFMTTSEVITPETPDLEEAVRNGMPAAIRIYDVCKRDNFLIFLVSCVDSAGNYCTDMKAWEEKHGQMAFMTISQCSHTAPDKDGSLQPNKTTIIHGGTLHDQSKNPLYNAVRQKLMKRTTFVYHDRKPDNPRLLGSWQEVTTTEQLMAWHKLKQEQDQTIKLEPKIPNAAKVLIGLAETLDGGNLQERVKAIVQSQRANTNSDLAFCTTPEGIIDYLDGLDRDWLNGYRKSISELNEELAPFNGADWVASIKEMMAARPRTKIMLEVDSMAELQDRDPRGESEATPLAEDVDHSKLADDCRKTSGYRATSSDPADIAAVLSGHVPADLVPNLGLCTSIVQANELWMENVQVLVEELAGRHEGMDKTKLFAWLQSVREAMLRLGQ